MTDMERATAIMDALRRRAYGWKSPEAQIAEALAAVREEALEEAARVVEESQAELDAARVWDRLPVALGLIAENVRALAARGRG